LTLQTANAIWTGSLPPFSARNIETKKHAIHISKLVAANCMFWDSSQLACVPVFHHRIKGALSY